MVICELCKTKFNPSNKPKSFHRFPRNPKILAKWIRFMKAATSSSNWFLKPHHRICSSHFDESDFLYKGPKGRLRPDAVPKRYFVKGGQIKKIKLDTCPSTSSVDADKLSQEINNSEELYSLSDSERKFKKRKMEAISFIQSLKSESDNESISFKTNVLSNEDEQLEFLTIIDEDDDISESSKPDEKQNIERSSSSPDKNLKILENLDNEPSSPEFEDCSSISISSMSDFEEELKESSLSDTVNQRNRPRYFGDCSFDDMKNPNKARAAWLLAKKTIADLKLKNKRLHRRNQRLSTKIQALRSLFRYLEENNFLNEYAEAAINAIILEKPA